MADVNLTFESDISKLEANNAKLEKQVASINEQLRKLKTTSKDASDTWEAGGDRARKSMVKAEGSVTGMSGAMQKAQSSIVGMIAPLVTIEAGISAASSMTKQWVQHTDRLVQLRKELEKTTVATVAPSGIPGEQVEKWLKEPSTATRASRLEALAQVSKTAPDMGNDRQLQIAAATAQHAVRGLDVMQKLSRTAADAGNVLSDRSAGDVVDISARLQTMLGDKTDQLGSDAFQRGMADLRNSGMSGTDAMAHAVAALRGDQKGNILTRMAKGDGDAKKFFAREAVPSIGGELTRAAERDYGNAQIADLQRFEGGRAAIAENMVAVAGEDASQSRAAGEQAQLGRISRFMREKAYERGPVAYAGSLALSAQAGMDQFFPRFHESMDARGQSRADAMFRSGEGLGIVSKEETAAFKQQEKMIAEMARMNANMEAANQQRAAVNVNAHNE